MSIHVSHAHYDEFDRTKAGGAVFNWFTPVAAGLLSILLSILVVKTAV
jgi:hypothetical protein